MEKEKIIATLEAKLDLLKSMREDAQRLTHNLDVIIGGMVGAVEWLREDDSV